MRKLNILHLNAGTCMGGTETMILRFLEAATNSRFNFYVAAFFLNGPLLDEATKRGAKTCLFQITKRYNVFQLIAVLIKLCRYLKSNKIDIVHMYGFWTNILGRLAIKLTKTPIGITGQRTEDNWRKWYHSYLDRITSRWVDLYISVFNKGKELLVKRDRIPENKIVVIHNGIDLNWAFDRHNDCVSPLIGMVAMFSPFKTHKELIQAAPKIIEKFPQVKFILVGGGTTKKESVQFISKLGLNSYFLMPGLVNNVRPILSTLSVFVLATHSEGLPVSVIEAMAHRLPVVASKVGGIPELIDDGVTGILIEPNNPEQLASAITELLQNPDKAKAMGNKAREKIMRDFSIQKMSSKILSYYIDLAKNKGIVS